MEKQKPVACGLRRPGSKLNAATFWRFDNLRTGSFSDRQRLVPRAAIDHQPLNNHRRPVYRGQRPRNAMRRIDGRHDDAELSQFDPYGLIRTPYRAGHSTDWSAGQNPAVAFLRHVFRL